MYEFDARTGRYRAPSGRFVSWAVVQATLQDALEVASLEADELARALSAGTVDVDTAAREMQRIIKNTHITATELAVGGRGRMTQADYGRAGQVIREQYAFLQKRMAEVRSGRQAMGRLPGSFRAYVQAGAETMDRVRLALMPARGFTLTRTRLDRAAENCRAGRGVPGCVEEDARGWHPTGEAVAIGQRRCRKACRCTREFQNPATGDTLT